MTLYEIDTFKQALKKYVVTFSLGAGIGLYLGCCTYRSKESEQNYFSTKKIDVEKSHQTLNSSLTREEQRLKVFESYTARHK